ncbi:MAG: hypothetical protein HQK91_05675 [Nitrospirae bacterium]|nr:hypothetical protein [Nitrospirota bacterium]
MKQLNYTTIRDNPSNGTVGEFLKQSMYSNSKVSIISEYFTINTFNNLYFRI